MYLTRPDKTVISYKDGFCNFERCLPEDEKACYIAVICMPIVVEMLPLTFIIISGMITVYFLYGRGTRMTCHERINAWIVVVKALCITFCFTLSWVPFFGTFHSKTDWDNLAVFRTVGTFLYINTLTDPCFYLIPNKTIARVVKKLL